MGKLLHSVMASSEAYEVVLSGGGPWGFRLQGGKEFRARLRIAKVTLGSKADKAGIFEGLIVRSINNNACDDWTHSDALNCIKKSGMVLELILSKRASPPQNSSQVHSYSYTTDDAEGSSKAPVPAEYKQVAPYATLPRGQQWVNTDSWRGSQNDDKDSAFSSPEGQANFGSNEWNPDIISNAVRPPEPIQLVPSSEMYSSPSNQNAPTVQVKAPENMRGFVDKPRPIGRGGRRLDSRPNDHMGVETLLHTESIGSDDDMNNNLPNGDTNSGDSGASRPVISHLRNKKEEAAVEATREPKPVAKVPPPAPAKPTRKSSQEHKLSDSEPPGPHRPSIKRGGQWYKDLFKEMHSTAGTASNLSALLANDAMKTTTRELDGTSAASSSPRSGSPSVEHPDNDVFYNKPSQNHDQPIRSSHSVSLSSDPRSSTSSTASGERKPSRSGHVPAWYKDLQRGSDVPVQKIEEPESYIVHRKQRSYDSLDNNPPANPRNHTAHVQVFPAARLGYHGNRKASSPAALVQTVQMEQRDQPPSATSLYESRFQRRLADPHRRASEQIPLSHRPPSADQVIREHEEEVRRLREEEEKRKRAEEMRREEEERKKREEAEAEQRRLQEEHRAQEQEAERRKIQQEETAMRAVQVPQFIAKALYTFKPQNPQELPFRKGDAISITRQIDKNWIEGVLDGRKGIFPRSYVDLMPCEEEEEPPVEEVAPPAPILLEGEARMKYNFKAESGRELACNKGDIMTLIRQVDDNWYEARIGNTRGIVPVRYVEVFREPELVTPAAMRQEQATRTEALRAEEVVDKRRSTGYDEFPPELPPSEPVPREPINEIPRNTFPVYSQPNAGPQVRYMAEPQLEAAPAIEPPQSVDDAIGMWNLQGERFRAVFSYAPSNEDELALDEGDEVLVLEKCDDGWYVGTSSRTNMFGTFPGNYVVKV